MPKSIPHINDIVSLTIMLLMVIALVAGQAHATIEDVARADGTFAAERVAVDADARFMATFKAHIDGHPLTISIDAKVRD